MPAALSLRTSERKRLLHYYRSHDDPSVRSRAHIILLLADRHPWTSIETMLFCSSRTIARWKERFEGGGIDALLGRSLGLKPRWSEEAEAVLRKALECSPHELGYLAVNWSVRLLSKAPREGMGPDPLRPPGPPGTGAAGLRLEETGSGSTGREVAAGAEEAASDP